MAVDDSGAVNQELVLDRGGTLIGDVALAQMGGGLVAAWWRDDDPSTVDGRALLIGIAWKVGILLAELLPQLFTLLPHVKDHGAPPLYGVGTTTHLRDEPGEIFPFKDADARDKNVVVEDRRALRIGDFHG